MSILSFVSSSLVLVVEQLAAFEDLLPSEVMALHHLPNLLFFRTTVDDAVISLLD